MICVVKQSHYYTRGAELERPHKIPRVEIVCCFFFDPSIEIDTLASVTAARAVSNRVYLCAPYAPSFVDNIAKLTAHASSLHLSARARLVCAYLSHCRQQVFFQMRCACSTGSAALVALWQNANANVRNAQYAFLPAKPAATGVNSSAP